MLSSRFTLTNQKREPVAHAQVVLVARNGTFIAGMTDEQGVVTLTLPDNQVGTLFIGHPEHRALLKPDFLPEEEHALTLKDEHKTGSVIFTLSTGNIPGLNGRLNPIQDTSMRTYIYGDNVAFNDQPAQPHAFTKKEAFIAEDAMRHRFKVTVLEIIGRTSLLEFQEQSGRGRSKGEGQD